jgi:tRNA(Ile)-lysidine synthase
MDLPQGGPVAIGFSGGGDSLALLVLACAHFSPARVQVLIVDHGLRDGSVREAKKAAAQADALGAKARILTSTNPRSGHKHARAMRYALLAKACRDIGSQTLFLAHTQDDQEETFIMRLASGSSRRGLACMPAYAPLPLWPDGNGLFVARPLLGTDRAALRVWLSDQNHSWIEDPSNLDVRYRRVRARKKLTALQSADLPPGRIAVSVDLFAQIEDQVRQAAQSKLPSILKLHPAGYAQLSRPAFNQCSDDQRRVIVDAVLAAIAGRPDHPVPRAVLDRVLGRLSGAVAPGFSAAGCQILCRDTDILICRDPGAMLGRAPEHSPQSLPIKKGKMYHFDRRFEIQASENGWAEALGARAKALQKEERRVLMALPAMVRPLIPVIRNEKGDLSSPILGGAGHVNFMGSEIITRKLAPISLGAV